MKKPLLLVLILTCFGCSESAVQSNCAELDVSEAWIREMPPGPQLTAGYLVLNNNDNQAITIEGFSSSAFARVELHESLQQNGVMQMRKMDKLVVPAAEGLALQPGGWHLMLFEPTQTPAAGQVIPLTLHCGSDEISVNAEVRKAGPSHHEHHGHH